MEQILIAEEFEGKMCAVLLEDGTAVEVLASDSSHPQINGNIYLGRIENIIPGINAAFVDIGLDKNAIIALDELKEGLHSAQDIKCGHMLPVQVIKLPGGQKGVQVSSNIKLAGMRCVLLPYTAGTGVSKKIEDHAEAERLRSIAKRLAPQGMGIILRTNAQGTEETELLEEINRLKDIWDRIENKSRILRRPTLLYDDSNVIFKAVRDMVSSDTVRIIASDKRIYEELHAYINDLSPDALDKLTLRSTDTSLFTLYRIKAQIDKALMQKVILKSGAFLVFDKTEALTVIDVNSGSFTGKSDAEETALKTNLEAAREIAVQLRLRDIGGIIIIDFIDMKHEASKQTLLAELRNELRKDHDRARAFDITQLGLAEVTRKRKNESLETVFNGRNH